MLLVLPPFLLQMTWKVFNFIQRKVHFADHLTIDWRKKINIPSELLHENFISSHIKIKKNMLSSHVKRLPSFWLHNKSHLFHSVWCQYNKQNITCPFVDMNFIFSCSTHEISSWTREDNIHIHVWACNILYIFNLGLVTFGEEVEVAWGWANYFWKGCYFLGSLHVLFGFTRGNVFWCYLWGRGVTTLRGSLLSEVYSMWIISIGGTTWQCIIT